MAEGYDGFISYSHAADDLLAPRLQAGLQRFAKPWWKRRAVRIFRDESSLSANPHLWSSITEALDTSGWFVLLLSPDAAQSEWVNQEIAYWVEHRDPKRILPVVTDGSFGWEDGEVTGDAVPDALRGVFSEEPRWVDVRWAKDEDQLDLQDPRFADAVADIASTIRGIPKDDLASEEVIQHRRTVRTAWAAGLLVLALGVVSSVAAFQASRNAALAASRELAASAIGVIDEDPELATLLALEAISRTPSGVEQPVEVVDALWKAGTENRLLNVIQHGSEGWTTASITSDGSRLVVGALEGNVVQMYDARVGDLLWEWTLETSDSLSFPEVSPDGSLVAVPILKPDSPIAFDRSDAPGDERPARITLLDGSTGAEVRQVEIPECSQIDAPAWTKDGSRLAVSSGPFAPCEREAAPSGWWVEVFDATTWESLAVLDLPEGDDTSLPGWGVIPEFDDDGRLFVFGLRSPLIFGADDLNLEGRLDAAHGFGDVSPDGASVLSSQIDLIEVSVVDATTDSVTDLLPVSQYPDVPKEIRFSDRGGLAGVGIRTGETIIWDLATGAEVVRLKDAKAPIIREADRLVYTVSFAVGGVKVWSLDPSAVGRTIVGDLDGDWVNSNSFAIGDTVGAFQLMDRTETESGVSESFSIVFFDLSTGALLEVPRLADTTGGPIPLSGDRFAYADEQYRWWAVTPDGDRDHLLPCGDCEGSRWTVQASGDGSELSAIEVLGDVANPSSTLSSGRWLTLDANSLDVVGEESHDLPVVEVQTIFDDHAGTVIAFGDDWILYHDLQNEVFAIDRQSGEVLWSDFMPIQQAMAEVSPYDDVAAIHANDSSVTIVELGTWETRRLDVNFSNPRGLEFSPDDRLAVGDAEGIHVVDLATDRVVYTAAIPEVSDFHWIDEDTLQVGTSDGLWARISLDIDDLVADVKASLARGFTDQECFTYRIDPCPTLDQIRSR